MSTTGIRTLEENITRLEEATARAREATSDANSAYKTLDKLRTEVHREIRDRAHQATAEILRREAQEHVGRMEEQIIGYMIEARRKITDEFIGFLQLVLTGGGTGPDIRELLLAHQRDLDSVPDMVMLREEAHRLIEEGERSEAKKNGNEHRPQKRKQKRRR